MNILRRTTLLIGLCLMCLVSLTVAQSPAYQSYRLLRMDNQQTATGMQWIEVWEVNDPANSQRDTAILEASADINNGITETCQQFHESPQLSSRAIYLQNGSPQPVDDLNQAYQSLPSYTPLDRYQRFAQNRTCTTSSTVNGADGAPLNQCDIDNGSADPDLPGVQHPASVTGYIHRNANGLVMSYDMTIQSANTAYSTVHDHFILVSPITVPPTPSSLPMQCFNGGLPLINGLQLISYIPENYAVFLTNRNPEEIRVDYGTMLGGSWNLKNDWDMYNPRFENQTLQCSIQLKYRPGVLSNGLQIFVEDNLTPTTITEPSLGIGAGMPDGLTYPPGEPLPLAATYQQEFTADGWILREELTDLSRSDSAFLTFERANRELHIIIEGSGDGRSRVNKVTRFDTCGTRFALP